MKITIYIFGNSFLGNKMEMNVDVRKKHGDLSFPVWERPLVAESEQCTHEI